MGAPVQLRDDFDGNALRRLVRRRRDAAQGRRLTALAVIYDGGSRSDAARIGGVTLQIVRDWVLRFNADGPDGLKDRWRSGPERLLDDDQRKALSTLLERGPDPAIQGVVRWRLADLVQWVWQEYQVSVSRQTMGRELRALGYRKISARPRHHAQDADAIPAFKKTSPPRWGKSGGSAPAASR